MFYAAAGRPELQTAIELVVQNCKDRYYGATDRAPCGPMLFGRAIAIRNNGLEYWVGDTRLTTPEAANWNPVYVTPDGRLLAVRTKRGSFAEFGIAGTNSYPEFWRSRQLYGEQEITADTGTLLTGIAEPTPTGFLIDRGTRGYAVYGPYIPLAAGRYRVEMWFDPTSQLGASTIDVCASFGVTVLKVLGAYEFSMDDKGCVAFDLHLASDAQYLEVRFHVVGDCEGRFLRLKIACSDRSAVMSPAHHQTAAGTSRTVSPVPLVTGTDPLDAHLTVARDDGP